MTNEQAGGCLSILFLFGFIGLWCIAEWADKDSAAQDRAGCSCSELEPSSP